MLTIQLLTALGVGNRPRLIALHERRYPLAVLDSIFGGSTQFMLTFLIALSGSVPCTGP